MGITESELRLFREVIAIIQQEKIYFWLDQGSLLGAIRDGAFLEWDHDIDIGMVIEPEIAHSITRKLVRLGGTVELYPYVIRIMRCKDEKPVDMRIYANQNGCFTTQLRAADTGKKGLVHRAGLKLSIVCQRAGSKVQRYSLARLDRSVGLNMLGESLYKAGFALSRIGDNWRHLYRRRIVHFRVNSKYFAKLHHIEIYGMTLPIPSCTEEYLTMKYGDDWMIPKRDWKYWLNDGAIDKQ